MAGKSTISITFKLDGDGNGFKQLAQSAEGLKQTMTATLVKSDELKASLINWSQSVQALGAVSNAIGQLNSVLQSVTEDSRAFSTAMRQANTMAGKDAEGFGDLKDKVSELSKHIPIARDELAKGLYQVISNGVPEDNWIDYLNKSAKASVGGIANLEEVVKVTSTAIKNYGLSWSDAESVQDKIQLTAKNGVTSFEQLAQALPRVTGNAANLGVSIDELLASFATLTGVSGNTAEVSTQLAAIFTALVKPSSEATQMAEKMGIQFNAASIKAAGGLRNFLTQLDAAVKQYAAANGALEQEVYGKLFGSAESLRAITPLTNQLADKFSENVDAMADSAGVMDSSYQQLNNTGSAVSQMLKNQFGALTDVVSGYVSGAMPVINFASQLGMMSIGIVSIVKAFKAINIQQLLFKTRTAASTVAMWSFGLSATRSAAVTRIFSAALRSGAYSATAFKLALKGLMITTVVGAAIVAVTSIIEHFALATDEATDKTEELDEAEEAYKSAAANAKVEIDNEIKTLDDLIKSKKDTTEAVNNLNAKYGESFGVHKTAAEWYDTLTRKSQIYVRQIGYEAQAKVLATKLAAAEIQLEENYAKRKALWESGGAQRKVVNTTPDPFGGSIGFTVSTEDTKAYTDLKNEARTLIPNIKSLQRQLGIAQAHMADCAKQLSTVNTHTGDTTKTLKVSAMTWQQVSDAIEATEKKLKNTTNAKDIAKLKAYNKQLHSRKSALEKVLGLETKSAKNKKNKKKVVADPKTVEELTTCIQYYSKKLTTANTAEQQQIRANIQKWQEKKDAIELARKAAAVPTEIKTLQDVETKLDYLRAKRKLASKEEVANIDKQIAETELLGASMTRPAEGQIKTLQDIDNEIEYQRKLRNTASQDAINGIDKEIARLDALRNYIENASVINTPDNALQTYEQLNIKLSYYNTLLEQATVEQRPDIQQHIHDLNCIKQAWDDNLAAMNKPADISALDTIAKLDEAVNYYQALQSHQTATEIQNTQRVIDALGAKRKALMRGTELPSMQKEVAEINALSKREFKVRIKSIGFDELTNRIRDLKKQLADTDNPVTPEQRKDIESLIATYAKWRKSSISTFDSLRDGWNGVKGISDGINSLSDALKGTGNAWEKVIAVVDAFLQLYDGLSAIIGVVQMITQASKAHTVAKSAETTATTASTVAQGVETAGQETAAAATIPLIAANKAATASFMELASAAYFAAHASIPFAGFGIASGFVASAKTIVTAIGATPFAKGGVVSGPTLALVGEYSGAKNNPEVIAPLDKLRDMIEPGGDIGGEVVFRLDGRTLLGVLKKEVKHNRRS